jgi:hypothetical protein
VCPYNYNRPATAKAIFKAELDIGRTESSESPGVPGYAFPLQGQGVDLKQIGRDLNVHYVLEGSVQRGGNRMRVNVQLIEAETGAHLWAERFDKPVADLFEMQDEIVSRFANRLGQELAAAEGRRAGCSTTPDSMDHYFLGLALHNHNKGNSQGG